MADDDEPKRRAIAHVIGEKLDDLSVPDFDERIAQLRAEIARLEAAKHHKQAAKDAASSIFRS